MRSSYRWAPARLFWRHVGADAAPCRAMDENRRVENRVTLNRIIVSTGNIGPSLAFYRDVVGLSGPASAEGFAMLSAGEGVELMLHERPATPSDTSVAASFVVPDVDATVRAWAERGGLIVDEPSDQPWGERQAVVRDPDGHLVCLATPAR